MLVCRLCHDILTYNRKFNTTLIMLAFASNLMLTIIHNNPLFSLGALGALSICRIRMNTKDPRDLGFVFWALTIGMSSSMGAYLVGLVGSIALSIVMMTVGTVRIQKKSLTLIVRGGKELIPTIQDILRKIPGSAVKSQNISPNSFEMVYQVRIPDSDSSTLIRSLFTLDGVDCVNLLTEQKTM